MPFDVQNPQVSLGLVSCPQLVLLQQGTTKLTDQTVHSTSSLLSMDPPSSSPPRQDYKEPIRELHEPSSQTPLDILSPLTFHLVCLHLLKGGHQCSSILVSLTIVLGNDAQMGRLKTAKHLKPLRQKDTPLTKIGHFVHSRL